ncbi:MAG: hypothetical protein ABIV50_04425 [Opitutus sp.]
MPVTSPDDLRRLHFINALFAHVTGHDLYLAGQIKEAITFSLAELQTQSEAHPEFAAKFDVAFNAAAAELLTKLFGESPENGFFHWDASTTLASATPLFTRAEVITGLKHLAPFREATLLITNLRPALIPPSRRATSRRLREYDEAVEFIQALASARTRRNANLQLLFL